MTAQTARVDNISFASLLGLLRSYESWLNRNNEIRAFLIANTIQSANIVICQICEKRGHMAIACYNQHNEQWFPTKHDKSKARFHYKGAKEASQVANAWYPDSGASGHVTGDLQNIQIMDADQNAKMVIVTNGNSFPIHHSRFSNFMLGNKFVHVKNIPHALPIQKNLLSVNKFCSDNFLSLRFDDLCVYLKDRQMNEEVTIKKAQGGMY